MICYCWCLEKCLSDVFDVFVFQAEDGIRDLVRSRGLGDVYKRQMPIQQPSSAEKMKFVKGEVSFLLPAEEIPMIGDQEIRHQQSL